MCVCGGGEGYLPLFFKRGKVKRILPFVVGNVAVDRFHGQEKFHALGVPTPSCARDRGVSKVTAVVDVARVVLQQKLYLHVRVRVRVSVVRVRVEDGTVETEPLPAAQINRVLPHESNLRSSTDDSPRSFSTSWVMVRVM